MIELALPKKRQTKRVDGGRSAPLIGTIPTPRIYDRFNSYPSVGLTPERLAQIFRNADLGDVFSQSELFEEILEKDPRLFGMFHSRINADLKLDYQITAASEDPKDKEISDYVDSVFDGIKNFNEARRDLLGAVPNGFSMLQINWKQDESGVWIENFEFARQRHFRFGMGGDPTSDLNQVRRLTETDRVNGIELEPNKWVAAFIKARSGHPSRASLLRTCAWMYLFKNFAVKAWVQFAELFGMPLRVGKYSQADINNKQVLDALADAIENLGVDASAMIPDTTKIEFVEAVQKAATSAIHGELASFCNQEMSVAILGHTSGAESTPGKLGNEQTVLEARADLVQSDVLAEGEIWTSQVIRPLVDFQFGPQEDYPSFTVLMQKSIDRLEEAQIFDAAINKIKIPLPKQHVYETLNIPLPHEGDDVILPNPSPPAFSPGFGQPSGLPAAPAQDKKKRAG